jgi:hypothetical protein
LRLKKGRRQGAPELGFTRVRQSKLSSSAKADLDCHAKFGNLMGFLDPFKAVFGALLNTVPETV